MFNDRSVMIVEDNVFLAFDLSQAIEELDGRVIGPTDQVSQALELLDNAEVAAAIVDGHLLGQDVAMLIKSLAERRIPFIIYAETELPEGMSALHPTVPVLRKPVQPRTVLECLSAEMHKTKGRYLE